MRMSPYAPNGQRIPHSRRWLGGALASILLALMGAPAVASSASPLKEQAKPVLTIGFNSTESESLNPAKDLANYYQVVRALTNEPLIYQEPNGSYAPGLATTWHYVGTGNTTFSFTLRHNARFSDGTLVTAQAVKTWLSYFNTANGPLTGVVMTPIQSITTVGEWTVVMHLTTPDPGLPTALAETWNWGAVSSPNAVAHPSLLATGTYGAGPYTLDPSESVLGSRYTFVPNKYYYDPAAIRWSKVIFLIIPTPSSLFQAMETGQVDVGMGDPSTVGAAANAGLKVIGEPFGYLGLAFLNLDQKPLSSVLVRQALNYAVDRATISKALIGSYGSPTSELDNVGGFDPAYSNYYPYNPAKAKTLLAAAGYPHGFTLSAISWGFIGNEGTPLIQAVAKYLAAVGVTLNITVGTTISQVSADAQSLKYDAVELSGVISTPTWVEYAFASKPGGFFNPFKIPETGIASAWNAGMHAVNGGPDWKKMTDIATSQAYFLPVSLYPELFYVSKNVGGVVGSTYRAFPPATEWYPISAK